MRVVARGEHTEHGLEQVLYEAIYREEQRLSNGDADSRSEGDRQFVSSLRHELAHADEADRRRLVGALTQRYAAEIAGHFDRRVYGVATRALPPALGALLHGGRPGRRLFDVSDRMLVEGELDALRAAARAGTLCLAATHVSNLDALVLGYAIYALGLPPVAYGAGLNLFTNPLTGFFMRNLGAFTVDRKKT